jgi:signal transduction histidine kinase
MLGAMLAEQTSLRTDDITADPRFGWFPSAHPRMRSFLGVPIISKGDVVGAFYLTDKVGAPRFDEADQALIELLAAHAAIAIENARLFELRRELTIADERTRLARELHDAMTQTLFSLNLNAETALGLVRSDPARAEAALAMVKELAAATMAQLRSLIDSLRPVEVEADGLAAALRAHVGMLARAHKAAIGLDIMGERRLGPDREREILRVVQEALHNALRHAGATRVDVALDLRGSPVLASVADDGVGFDPGNPAVGARRLGLTSMRERARVLGGRLEVRSARGQGTTVRLEAPDA